MAGDPVEDEPSEVDAFEPAHRAHELRLAGLPWREVAIHSGYKSMLSAKMAVTAYLQRAAILAGEDQAKEALATEIERLDALHNAWWRDALNGDEKAAMVILRISQQRVKIYELLFADKDTSAGPRTVVISGDTEEYIAGLRAISDAG